MGSRLGTLTATMRLTSLHKVLYGHAFILLLSLAFTEACFDMVASGVNDAVMFSVNGIGAGLNLAGQGLGASWDATLTGTGGPGCYWRWNHLCCQQCHWS